MIWKFLSNHLSHWKVEELFFAACSAQCSMLRTGRLRSRDPDDLEIPLEALVSLESYTVVLRDVLGTALRAAHGD